MLTIQLAPNCSLTRQSAALFYSATCLVSFTIAGTLALHGLWPVLPFAGLEMLGLGWALAANLRRRDDWQTIVVTEERVAIQTRLRRHSEQVEFSRHWAQVRLRGADRHLHPSRLTIESHGRSCEVGSFLTEEERRALAQRLRRSVGRVNQSPSLD
jgi:uncharacterized membrane protein